MMRVRFEKLFAISVLVALSGCSGADPIEGTSGAGGTSNPGSSGAGGVGVAGGPSPSAGQAGAQGGSGTAGAGNAPGTAGGGSGGAFPSAGTGGTTPSGGTGGNGGSSGGGASGGTAGNTGGTAPLGGTGGGGNAPSAGAGGSGPRPPCTPPLAYRNLFAELLSKTDAEVDAKLNAGYQQLFHGKTDNIYYESGSDEGYILDVNSNDVRTESQSYGMMVAVQMDKKDVFNRIWKWTKRVMYRSSGPIAGYFAWKATPQGQVTAEYSAPDGEEYFATALIFASKRWGDGSGINAYSTEAKNLLDALATRGNFNRSNYLVTFGNQGASAGYTDASYVLPAFYEVWACVDTKNQQFWKNAVTAGRAFFPKACHPNTMLAPNFSNFDGSPYNGSTFASDAWRVVGNIMMDHHFFNADPWQVNTFAPKFAAFFEKAMAMRPVPDEFQIDGTVTHSNADPAKGLVAQNAMVAFGVPAADGAPFVQALWDMEVPTGQYRYYDGMLYLLSFMHVSGRFKLYY